jgi:hypothetical protein
MPMAVRRNIASALFSVGAVFSNAFSPREIYGLALWLRSDLGVAPLTWADQSGKSNDATAASGEMPTTVAAVINGLPILRFNGTNRMTISGTTLGLTGAFSCLIVSQTTGSGTGRDQGIFGNGTSHHFQMTHDLGSTRDDYLGAGANGISYSLGENTWTIQTFVWDGTTGANKQQDYKNGVLQAQKTSTRTPSDMADYKVGIEPDGASFFVGDIAEVILFKAFLSSTDLRRMTRYAGSRYVISVTI